MCQKGPRARIPTTHTAAHKDRGLEILWTSPTNQARLPAAWGDGASPNRRQTRSPDRDDDSSFIKFNTGFHDYDWLVMNSDTTSTKQTQLFAACHRTPSGALARWPQAAARSFKFYAKGCL